MTITEFLLARIAEDELEVGPAGPDEGAGPNGIGWAEVGALSEVLMARPSRVLAECEAKRRIVADHAPIHLGDDWWCSRCDQTEAPGQYDDQRNYLPSPCPTLLALASVYADHPDFREEWRAIE